MQELSTYLYLEPLARRIKKNKSNEQEREAHKRYNYEYIPNIGLFWVGKKILAFGFDGVLSYHRILGTTGASFFIIRCFIIQQAGESK